MSNFKITDVWTVERKKLLKDWIYKKSFVRRNWNERQKFLGFLPLINCKYN